MHRSLKNDFKTFQYGQGGARLSTNASFKSNLAVLGESTWAYAHQARPYARMHTCTYTHRPKGSKFIRQPRSHRLTDRSQFTWIRCSTQMHELLRDAESYVYTARPFGRQALETSISLIHSANHSVNLAIQQKTINLFDVPRINRDLDELERKANARFRATCLRMQELDRRSRAKTRIVFKSLTLGDLRQHATTQHATNRSHAGIPLSAKRFH